jgi:hypothetical protein
MNKTEAVVQRYAKALQFYLAYIPNDDDAWDRRIWQEFVDVDTEVREFKLEGTPEYSDAVLRADHIAREIRMQRWDEK